MHVPELNLREYPEFVQDKIDASDANSMKELHEYFNEAISLNEKTDYKPAFELTTEELPYDDYVYPKAYFCYFRKPYEAELNTINSYNYRMIENYNKFINDNPKVAKALEMSKVKQVSL